jgi:hypothetical protein
MNRKFDRNERLASVFELDEKMSDSNIVDYERKSSLKASSVKFLLHTGFTYFFLRGGGNFDLPQQFKALN